MATAISRWAIVLGCAAATVAHAMIFYATGDPTYNTSAPTGALANSGWQWVGEWSGSSGTSIGPHHFLTSRHIGGAVGDMIKYQGDRYRATALFDDTATDLRVVAIEGEFRTWAPLYRRNDELGRHLVVVGNGDARGNPIEAAGVEHGWYWGSDRGVMRWGENVVVAAFNGPTAWGPLLHAVFDPGIGRNVVDLAGGDSGSPVFINDGTGWKLAGIAASVDGPFSDSPTGSSFDGAIYDARGLYRGPPNARQRIDAPRPIRAGFYATRVSQRLAWIDSILNAPMLTESNAESGLPQISVAGAK